MKKVLAGVVIFIAGLAVGAMFYPSSRLEEQERTIAELRTERQKLEIRASWLESRIRETVVEDIFPDGRRTVRTERESDQVARATSASAEIELHQEEVRSERTKITETSRRRFGISAGVMTDRAYFLHVDADLIGPVFVGVHADSRGRFGVGIGLRF